MRRAYTRITLEQRIVIEKLLALGRTRTQIANAIGYHKSAVGRDVKLCKKDKYSAMEATRFSVGDSSNRRDGKSKPIQNKPRGNVVFEKLRLHGRPNKFTYI